MNNTIKINEWKRPINQDIIQTIEKTIHDKINTLKADFRQPWCIILNEEAYFALCYKIREISGAQSLHLEQYRGLTVILDRTSIDAIKVLQKPFDELTLSSIGAKKEKEKVMQYPECFNHSFKRKGAECTRLECQICATNAVEAILKNKENNK